MIQKGGADGHVLTVACV